MWPACSVHAWFIPLCSLLTLLRLYWTHCCSSNIPDTLLPQGLCTYCFFWLEHSWKSAWIAVSLLSDLHSNDSFLVRLSLSPWLNLQSVSHRHLLFLLACFLFLPHLPLSPTVMIHFTYCQLDWTMEYPDIYLTLFLGVSVSVFLGEINIWICRLRKADYPPHVDGPHPLHWRHGYKKSLSKKGIFLSVWLSCS